MKNKSDFVAVIFNENEPHTAKEWLIYWGNRYHLNRNEKPNLTLLMKDKTEKGLVSDAIFDTSGKCYILM